VKQFFGSVLIFLICFGAGVVTGWFCKPVPPTPALPQTDTLYIRDTLTVIKPVYITKRVTDSVYVPVTDTLRVHDTLLVALPIEQRVYEDSTYRAVVSGFRPSLDTIAIYPVTMIVPVTEKVKTQPKFSVGVQAGFGVSYQQGFHAGPYIGIGIQYNLLNF